MKKRRLVSDLLIALGMAMALGTIWVIILAFSASPVMLKRPAAAVDRAEAMMRAVCQGDYETASDMIYGSPSLGAPPEDSSPAVSLLWDGFLESLEYEFLGECYASNSGVAIDVRVRSMDISCVVDDLDGRAQTLLNQRIEMAQDSTELYDEDNNFRPDMIAEILRDAAVQALAGNRKYQEQTISLHLVFERGEWWVMPEADLLNVLSGSMPG